MKYQMLHYIIYTIYDLYGYNKTSVKLTYSGWKVFGRVIHGIKDLRISDKRRTAIDSMVITKGNN